MDELYDLINDPIEVRNLIQNEEHHDVLATLKKKLLQHLKEIEDPMYEWFKKESAQ